MEYAVGVAPMDAIQQLPAIRLYLRGRELVADGAHVLLEVGVAELESEVETAFRVKDVLQLDDVLVVQFSQDGDLAQRGRRHAVLLALKPHLLECDDLPGLDMARFVHHAERALAELLELLVVRVDTLHGVDAAGCRRDFVCRLWWEPSLQKKLVGGSGSGSRANRRPVVC